jgi:hypothetical protein
VADVWTDLLFFESRDLAGRSYRLLHKRPLSAAKAAEIIANLAQARGYFKSASSADDLVRPLLLYYGVLALARSLVLFLDRDKREASMHQAHGLITSGWDKTLTEATESAAKRLRRLPELAVEFPAGAFSEFIEATGNVERSYVNVGPFPDRRWLERPRPLDLARPFKITLKDVLARIPELSDSFERGFEARSAA